MTLVDWNDYIPSNLGARVLFSALALPPHKDKVDANLVAIELPGGLFIDVEFIRAQGHYVVTLYADNIDYPIRPPATCLTVSDVIQKVTDIAEVTRLRSVNAPASKAPDTTYLVLADLIEHDTARVSSASRSKSVKIKRPLEFA